MLVVTSSSTKPKLSSSSAGGPFRACRALRNPRGRTVRGHVKTRLSRVMGHAGETAYVKVEHPP